MKRLLAFLTALCLVLPYAAPAQSPAIQHLLRYKRPAVAAGGTCTFPTFGNKIVELDPADTAKIFTTIAGSTNPVDGDPVGRWIDKNGSYAFTAAGDNGTRPTWRENVGGKPYVDFDGTDDVLLNTSASVGLYGGAAASSTLGIATRAVAATQGVIISESDGTTAAFYYTTRQEAADFNDLQAWLRRDDGAYQLNNVAFGAEILPAATDASVIITDSNVLVTGYLDNSSVGDTGAYTRTGTITIGRTQLGARSISGGAPTNFYAGRIYYLIAYDSVAGSTDRGTLDTALKCTQGR